MDGREGTDRRIAVLAGRQSGTITRTQLLRLGLFSRAIDRRIAASRLIPITPGVYRVGHAAPSREAAVFAAHLACGDDSSIARTTALECWAMLEDGPATIHVAIPPRRVVRRHGLQVHRVRVEECDRRSKGGLPLTAPALSLLDSAADLDEVTVERGLSIARSRGLIRFGELDALAERYPRRRGWKRLGDLLRDERAPEFTRSEAESRLLKLVADAGLAPPRRNCRLGGYEVDFWWPELRLVIEVDGFASHGGRTPFEADRARDIKLRAHGIEVVRLTWRQIVSEREATMAKLAKIAAHRARVCDPRR